MKVTKNIIEKIEGEARVDLTWEEGRVVDSKVEFFSYRGMEEIIQGRSPLDALVLTPRVCGICGHAQLFATVKALENLYERNGIEIELSNKAKKLREITLNCEIIQNHIKWLYFVLLPLVYGLEKKEFAKNKSLEALSHATLATKTIALFAGQWPHNSYMIPGGVVCDPTLVEIFQAKEFIEKIINFFEKEIVVERFENIVAISFYKELFNKKGVLRDIVEILQKNEIDTVGCSNDRFLVLGESSLFKSGKSIKTVLKNINERYIEEEELDFTYAKNALYNGKFYEVGPLARAMVLKNPLIKSLHRVQKDSLLNRIVAKVFEVAHLLKNTRDLLNELDIDEKSFIKPKVKIETIEGYGVGFAEAARGSLYHKIEIEEGKIKKYDIITPTQWNLGNSLTKEQNSTIKEALLGIKSDKVAGIVFRSFDECSVCTTH